MRCTCFCEIWLERTGLLLISLLCCSDGRRTEQSAVSESFNVELTQLSNADAAALREG